MKFAREGAILTLFHRLTKLALPFSVEPDGFIECCAIFFTNHIIKKINNKYINKNI